jgi:hypothetical protein
VALVGLGATVYGFTLAGGFPRLPLALLATAPLVVGATIANLLVRFVRWQFLLRRVGVRVAAVPALGAFVGSFAFLPVPLYVGHLAARVRLLRVAPELVPRVVLAFAVEQGLNVWALALVASPAIGWWAAAALLLVAALAFARPVRRRIVRLVGRVVAPLTEALETASVDPVVPEADVDVRVPGVAAALSLAAWALVAVAVLPLLWAVDVPVDPAAPVVVAARAILEGAVSLVPLGASVSGIALLRGLEALGAPVVAASGVVFVFRAATAWLSVVLGGAALLGLRRARRHGHTHDHFDAIDECYDVAPAALPRPSGRAEDDADDRADRGARNCAARPRHRLRPRLVHRTDAGGGGRHDRPRHVRTPARRRPRVPGRRRAARAGQRAPPAVRGADVRLRLHHQRAPSRRDAARAARRRRRDRSRGATGGLVFVHEMSARNPLFRIYLEYVYPITKGIEEGTEYYLDPRGVTDLPGLRVLGVGHFTFIPDFVPRAAPWLALVERRLEASPLAPWAAHFLAVYQRVA